MQEEARDFEALRAELDARMKELTGESGEGGTEPLDIKDLKPAERTPPKGGVKKAELPSPSRNHVRGFLSLDQVERRHIVLVLEAVRWRISGPKGAARILGLNPSTLRSRMKKLGISRDISRIREI